MTYGSFVRSWAGMRPQMTLIVGEGGIGVELGIVPGGGGVWSRTVARAVIKACSPRALMALSYSAVGFTILPFTAFG